MKLYLNCKTTLKEDIIIKYICVIVRLQMKIHRHCMYEWMTCDFTSFSTVFQLYQDNDRMIMTGCVQWNLVYGWKDSRLERGSNPGPLDQ